MHRLLALATLVATAADDGAAVVDDRELPHVNPQGWYDTSWYAANATSLEDLRRLAPADGHAAVLVALVDDLLPDESACADLHESCEFWAKEGECANNPSYMHAHCFKSCGRCDQAPESCGAGGYDVAKVALRNAQRFKPQRYMATAVARRSAWAGEWPLAGAPGNGCGGIVLEPRSDWAAQLARKEFGDGQRDLDHRIRSYLDAADVRHRLRELAEAAGVVDPFVVRNALDREITLHWFDVAQEEGLRADPWREVARIPPGAKTKMGSHVGHVFAAADADGFLGKIVVRGAGDAWSVDDDLLAEAETCSGGAAHVVDPHAAKAHRQEMERLSSLEGAAGRDARVKFAASEFARELAFEKRKALSDVQIAVCPNVTEDGFRLIRTPAHIYERVLDFYESRHLKIRRPEGDGGPLYNQRQVRTWHTPLPPDTKQFVFAELQKVMEAWAPTTAPLKGTSAYGVRTYERGSYLHLHVDTANTHVVSGIMNVAQDLGANGTDWPVEILDHAGKLHAVNMKPGDLLLYESARLLHGRPSPLDGESYANIFVHYMPEKGWRVDF